LVTGGGSGFGEAISHAYVKEGANVLIGDFVVDSGKRVEADIAAKKYPGGASAVFVEQNVTKKDDWVKALDLAKSKFGKLDIVVNNAGTTYKKQASEGVSEQDFDRIINVNCKSIYLSATVLMPYFMEQKGGVFLNTSSVAATRTRPGQVWYGGTKGFVNTITQGLTAEYGPHGVRVNSICPLRGATGLLEMFSGTADTPEERERFSKTVPLGRMSEAQDVANAAVFLASDEASFISGANFPVDGGRLAV